MDTVQNQCSYINIPLSQILDPIELHVYNLMMEAIRWYPFVRLDVINQTITALIFMSRASQKTVLLNGSSVAPEMLCMKPELKSGGPNGINTLHDADLRSYRNK
jgi:hypothetical protein